MGGEKRKTPVPDYGTRVKNAFHFVVPPTFGTAVPFVPSVAGRGPHPSPDLLRRRLPPFLSRPASSLMARFSVRRCTGYSCVLAAVHTLGIISVISRFVMGGVWAEGSRPSGEGRPGKAVYQSTFWEFLGYIMFRQSRSPRPDLGPAFRRCRYWWRWGRCSRHTGGRYNGGPPHSPDSRGR